MNRTSGHWRQVVCGAALALGAAACGDEPAELLEPEACTARGGTVIPDPGDGRTREGCPEGQVFLGNVNLGIEGAICCKQ